MDTSKNSTLRALRDFGLVVAASAAAASIWAAGLPEQSYLLDADLWQEVAASPAAANDWPADGWYRLLPQEKAVDVRAVHPGDKDAYAADELYFRLPGTRLKEGARATYRHASALAQPKLGQDHVLSFNGNRFTLRVESGVKGMQYAIGYGNQTYSYTLGPFDATTTSVRTVADLDGDAKPDFLIDVGDEATYLLLSTHARPGHNLPTAELWARGC
jgi:hypothetical protein